MGKEFSCGSTIQDTPIIEPINEPKCEDLTIKTKKLDKSISRKSIYSIGLKEGNWVT